MKNNLNKSVIFSVALLVISTVFFALSDVQDTVVLGVFCFGLFLLVGIVNLQRMSKANHNRHVHLSSKINSISNSLKSLHSKVDNCSQLIRANDVRGRRILEISADLREFDSKYVDNARELNLHLGKIVNRKVEKDTN